MSRMPRNKRVKDWAEYLNETDQSVDEAIEKTSSFATAGFLRNNRHRIEARMSKLMSKSASFEAKEVAFADDEEVIEILGSSEASPNEPDEPQGEPSSEPQRGVKV